MRAFAENENLSGQKIELVVRPGIKLHILDTKDSRRDTLIAAKASVMVFLGEMWKENRRQHDEAQANAMDVTDPTQNLILYTPVSQAKSRQEREAETTKFKRAAELLGATMFKRAQEKRNSQTPESNIKAYLLPHLKVYART